MSSALVTVSVPYFSDSLSIQHLVVVYAIKKFVSFSLTPYPFAVDYFNKKIFKLCSSSHS